MTTVVIGDNTGNDYSGTIDTQIKEGAATTNYGTDTTTETTHWGTGDVNHNLMAFTGLSNITPTVTVSSATIDWYLTGADYSAISGTVEFHRVFRNWVEAQATWNVYSTGNSWTTAGCNDTTNDRSSTVSATAEVNTTTEYKAFTSAQLATDTEGFINGTYSNYGWRQWLNETINLFGRYWGTSEYTDGSRPKLTVVYTASGGGSVLPLIHSGLVGHSRLIYGRLT